MTKMLTTEEFAEIVGLSTGHVSRLAKQGRITGKVRKTKAGWQIPENAKIKGAGVRRPGVNGDSISVAQFARRHGRSRIRAYQLLNQGRVEGAKKTRAGWSIPHNAEWPADDGFG